MTFGELLKIYELTYKYQMLREQYRRDGGWLRDVANVAFLKIQSKLYGLLDKALEEMISLFDGWLTHHYDMTVDTQMSILHDEIQAAESAAYRSSKLSTYRTALDDLAKTLSNFNIEISEDEKNHLLYKIHKALKTEDADKAPSIFSDFLWEDLWASIDDQDVAELAIKMDREYNAIAEHKDELEEAYYGRGRYDKQQKPKLDDMLIQFHIGLHISHHNGVMAEHLLENVPAYEGSVNEFLKALSSGMFVDKWDRELAKIIGNRYDPEVEDSQFIDWSERGRIRNPDIIPAPEFHIFIRE